MPIVIGKKQTIEEITGGRIKKKQRERKMRQAAEVTAEKPAGPVRRKRGMGNG
jgi:hypothetical protein